MKFLLLWDIDGTLITSGGAGMHALQVALHKTFGINGLVDDIDFAGRTDRWIMRQIFAKFGLEANEANINRYTEAYLLELPEQMSHPRARILPGVRDLLAAAGRRAGVAQGLLTGNLERGAQVKLSYHQLWDHFPFGAFADDSELRNDLGPHALRRAKEKHGVEFDPQCVWIIGDTPHDIACARAFGAKALAVATGGHTLTQLLGHRPDAALADLGDPLEFWRIVGA